MKAAKPVKVASFSLFSTFHTSLWSFFAPTPTNQLFTHPPRQSMGKPFIFNRAAIIFFEWSRLVEFVCLFVCWSCVQTWARREGGEGQRASFCCLCLCLRLCVCVCVCVAIMPNFFFGCLFLLHTFFFHSITPFSPLLSWMKERVDEVDVDDPPDNNEGCPCSRKQLSIMTRARENLAEYWTASRSGPSDLHFVVCFVYCISPLRRFLPVFKIPCLSPFLFGSATSTK